MPRRIAGTAATLAVLAGCAGSSNVTVPTPAPLDRVPTREEFIAVADAICSTLNAKTAPLGQPSDRDGVIAVLDEVIPLTGEALDDLRALAPPAGDEDEVASILDTFDRGVSVARELRAAVESGDPAGIQDAQQRLAEVQTEGNALASAYGMSACARS